MRPYVAEIMLEELYLCVYFLCLNFGTPAYFEVKSVAHYLQTI